MVSGNDWRRSAYHDRGIRSVVPDTGGNHCRGAVRIQIKKEPTNVGSRRKYSANGCSFIITQKRKEEQIMRDFRDTLWDIFLEWVVPALVSVATVLITVAILRRLGVM